LDRTKKEQWLRAHDRLQDVNWPFSPVYRMNVTKIASLRNELRKSGEFRIIKNPLMRIASRETSLPLSRFPEGPLAYPEPR